nr:MAG TPA: hypothetical protein [Caudoviricetes sp.]
MNLTSIQCLGSLEFCWIDVLYSRVLYVSPKF